MAEFQYDDYTFQRDFPVLAAEARRAHQVRRPVDADQFRRTAPKWNCVDYADGMHYTPADVCLWCGKTREQIAALEQ